MRVMTSVNAVAMNAVMGMMTSVDAIPVNAVMRMMTAVDRIVVEAVVWAVQAVVMAATSAVARCQIGLIQELCVARRVFRARIHGAESSENEE